MKFSLKFSAFLLTVLLVIPTVGGIVFASEDAIVSPAMAVLSNKMNVTVTGICSSPAVFSREDFDLSLGTKVDKITILTLPDPAEGTLMLGNTPVAVNQSISRKNFGKLSFRPVNATAESEFYFTIGGGYSVVCSVLVLDRADHSPVMKENNVAVETMKGVSLYGSVSAVDPENGNLSYYVTKAPTRGSVKITDTSIGSFVYTPEKNRGTDSFEISAVDEYGNWSAPAKIKVTVSKNKSGIEYADLDGHWAEVSAVKMTNAGIMNGSYVDGDAYFYPSESVSREDFVTMLMKTIGLSDIGEITGAVFADDGEISDANRNYCRAAEKLGFINGTEAGGKAYFNPKSTITRAEVAVILQNIIGVDVSESAVPVYADADTIPAWAVTSVIAMKELGIMNGVGGGAFSPNSTLTRAEVAAILSAVSELVV